MGKLKLKGAYWYPQKDSDYEGNWNKDFSALVIQKAAVLCMLTGCRPEDAIRVLPDPFDFMLRHKTPNGSVTKLGGRELSKTTRYYVSVDGEEMVKHSPAKGVVGGFKRKNGISQALYNKVVKELTGGWNNATVPWDERIHTKNKSVYTDLETKIESGRLVRECNVASKFNWSDVDWAYYTEEVRKLVIE